MKNFLSEVSKSLQSAVHRSLWVLVDSSLKNIGLLKEIYFFNYESREPTIISQIILVLRRPLVISRVTSVIYNNKHDSKQLVNGSWFHIFVSSESVSNNKFNCETTLSKKDKRDAGRNSDYDLFLNKLLSDKKRHNMEYPQLINSYSTTINLMHRNKAAKVKQWV